MERRSGSCQKASWRAAFQRKYLRQLAAVLRQKRIEPATSVLARSRAVKVAADLSLAITTRGRTAWSRAILRKCLFRLNKSRCQRRSVDKSRRNSPRSASAENSRPCKSSFVSRKSVRRVFGVASRSGTSIPSHGNEETEGTVASRMKTLRTLVPGNRTLDPPVFLKETADYIVALKMQVQAMQALADWCTNQSAYAACQV